MPLLLCTPLLVTPSPRPHLDSEVKVLTPEKWVSYLSLFEVSGYGTYETVGLVEVGEDEGQPADGGRVQRILELREILERLQSQLYDVFELMREQNLSEEDQRAVGSIWLNRLRDQLQPLADVQPGDIVETIQSLKL
jgi:hypothetical protein